MKLPFFIKLSLKYLWRYKRRYLFLFLALGFGFGVITVISSLKDGMKENLYLSAQSHYAGDITAVGFEAGQALDEHLTRTEQEAILAAAETAGLDPASIAIRTTIHAKNGGSIFFNGNSIALKHIVGADWNEEKSYFEHLSYAEAPGYWNEDSILLSRPIADELGIRRGDSITLEVMTVERHKNTGNFVVSGIVEDASVFGYYKVYVSRLSLNRLAGIADEDCSLIGFFLKNRKIIEQKRKNFHDALKTRINTGPLVYDRNSLSEEIDKSKTGLRVFLITLPVYLSEVAQLMDAIDLASYVLFGMMLAIIMVSAVVTCRLILHERTKETGTMRAIGFYEADLRYILQLEIAIMALFSLAAGFLLALLINRILSHSSFGWFPGFEVFTQNGKFTALYLPGTTLINILITGIALSLAAGGPIFRNSRNPLPEMLSGGAL
ncbi:MAG: FtsX-like permease family protein [Treponema sp.]|jgi:putative ABC transport system permease protein|nr:FtsX-like permease family protein [Treponema sp.]